MTAVPLVNVIRGERLPPSLLNVRAPVLRMPPWAVLSWRAGRTGVRLLVWCVRRWRVTGPVVLALWLWAAAGTFAVVGVASGLGTVLGIWMLVHRSSFLRWFGYPVVGRWCRMTYRRSWQAAMATAGLAVVYDGGRVLPVLRSVRRTAAGDEVTVRMVTGQVPDDYARVSLRLAHAFGALTCRTVATGRPDLVRLVLRRTDPLRSTVPAMPAPSVLNTGALPVGRTEDGSALRLRLSGTQILVAGATGAGKGSVLWSLVASLSGGIRAGLVRLWVFDPKGGMEFAAGRPLFDRFLCDDFGAMADALDQAVTVLRDRSVRLRGRTRQHTPSEDEPLYVIVIDELAALTAYLTDRGLRERIRAALGVILTQGRAVGVHVVAAVQDPRKDVLPFRDLFPTRIGLRLTEPSHVDMVLGEGMRDRGALCDRIPQEAPGVGYVVLDGDPAPVRVRFSHWTDEAVTVLARDHGRLRLVDEERAA